MIHRLLNALILSPEAYHYQAPADLGLCAEAVTFPNQQGLPLQGLLCWKTSQESSPSLCPKNLPVVLFCPGTSGNLSTHLHYIELLCRAGFAVLGFDYTGFGRNAGKAWLKRCSPMSCAPLITYASKDTLNVFVCLVSQSMPMSLC